MVLHDWFMVFYGFVFGSIAGFTFRDFLLTKKKMNRDESRRRDTERNIGQRFSNAIGNAFQNRLWINSNHQEVGGYYVSIGVAAKPQLLTFNVDLMRKPDWKRVKVVFADGSSDRYCDIDNASVEEAIKAVTVYLWKF